MTKPIGAKELLELDSNLEVEMLQCYPIPEQVIYQAAKCDYSEEPIHKQEIPSPSVCGERIVEMLLSNDRGHFGCYSSDTQVLTDKGWVYWPEVTEDTVIAAYDTKNHEIKYEKPSAIQKWDYNGKMYHSSELDLLVSPDHRIIFEEKVDSEWVTKILTAEDFYHKAILNRNLVSFKWFYVVTEIHDNKPYLDFEVVKTFDQEWVDYNGTIHCATVSTGAVVVRRNDEHKGIVCGNCLEHPAITFSVSGYVHNVMVQARTHRVGVTFDCLAAESQIATNAGVLAISELFERFEQGEKLPLVRNLNEDTGKFDYAEIGQVFKNGRKHLYLVTLVNGKELRCSRDHRIFTDTGWERLENLGVGVNVACECTEEKLYSPISSIKFLRTDITYDIEVNGKYHNFVCDGIVVHNCQSQRYTGKRVLRVANGELPVEDVFYVRPPGFYTNRKGKKYDWTQKDYDDELNWIHQGCIRYAEKYERGMSEEHIRDYLAQAIRQNFVVSFNLRSVLHMMDLRAKRDAQLEIQAFMEQLVPHIKNWAPHVWNYYEEKRLYKARLSP